MESSYAIRRHRGFTMTEIVVAVAIFATVMAGVAAVFISSLHASDAARAKLQIVEQFRAFSDFVGRDISCAYRSEDLDDRATFMGAPDRLAFITLTQNFGEDDADFSLLSYYLVDDPESIDRPVSDQFKRLIRLAIPLSYEAVEAFMAGYMPDAIGEDDEVGGSEEGAYVAFPPPGRFSELGGLYSEYVSHLQENIAPRDMLFPQNDDDLQALLAVLHGLYDIEYGWQSSGPNRFENVWLARESSEGVNINDSMAPLIDDFELVTLVLAHEPGSEFGRVVHGPDGEEYPLYPLKFRFGRINPRDNIGPPPAQGPGGYILSPRDPATGREVTFDNTIMYGVQDNWNAVAEGGPPEVVEVNLTFVSRTRAVRDRSLATPFYSLIYLPMAFDSGRS